MEHMNTTNADVKKKCGCVIRLHMLWDDLLQLFVRKSTTYSHVTDSSRLHDGNSLVDSRPIHEHKMISEESQSVNEDTVSVEINVPLVVDEDASPSNSGPALTCIGNHISDGYDDRRLHGDNSDSDPHPSLFHLPDDIIIEILSRLTLKRALVCRRACRLLYQLMSAPSYNHKLLSRTAPTIVVKINDEDNKLSDYQIVLNFVYENGYKIVPVTTDFRKSDGRPCSKLSLFGSYDGLLQFTNTMGLFLVFNPVTQEKVIVTSVTHRLYQVCGLYFHTGTGEYRILYVHRNHERPYRFVVLSLRSRLLREISNCTVAPCTCKSPVILNGALHWMATVTGYTCSDRESPNCSNSVLVFEKEKENFLTMPHPGTQCCSRDIHRKMQLLGMDGRLCLLDFSLSSAEAYLWVLQNYTEKVWVKEHIINIKPISKFYIPETHHFPFLQPVIFQNDVLLLRMNVSDLLYYHLKQRTFRGVKRRTGFQYDGLDSVVAHTNTLASLQCDSVISF